VDDERFAGIGKKSMMAFPAILIRKARGVFYRRDAQLRKFKKCPGKTSLDMWNMGKSAFLPQGHFS